MASAPSSREASGPWPRYVTAFDITVNVAGYAGDTWRVSDALQSSPASSVNTRWPSGCGRDG